MVFPFHRASQKTDSPRSHGRITTVIALFLMALLAGGLFFQNTALKAKEREKARQEEMVKRQQADKARALKKSEKRDRRASAHESGPSSVGAKIPSQGIHAVYPASVSRAAAPSRSSAYADQTDKTTLIPLFIKKAGV